MKKLIGLLAAVAALAIPTVASADNHASACGQAHGAFASSTQETGNFGWLGALGGTPGYHNGAVGQDPGATGSNNSSVVC
jgi:hypothetical protein